MHWVSNITTQKCTINMCRKCTNIKVIIVRLWLISFIYFIVGDTESWKTWPSIMRNKMGKLIWFKITIYLNLHREVHGPISLSGNSRNVDMVTSSKISIKIQQLWVNFNCSLVTGKHGKVWTIGSIIVWMTIVPKLVDWNSFFPTKEDILGEILIDQVFR